MTKVSDIKAFPFQFSGKGKVLLDGKEVNAEIKFLGKITDIDRSNASIELVKDDANTMWGITYFDLDK